MKDKLDRAVNIYGFDKKNAEKEIKKIDKLRSNHYKYYTGGEWSNASNYDICMNSDLYGVEKTADIICNLVLDKVNKKKSKIKEKSSIFKGMAVSAGYHHALLHVTKKI